MDKGVVRKSVIFVILLLFFGANILPCINGEINKINTKIDEENIGYNELNKMSFSKPPREDWNKTFGGENDDFTYEVQQTSDEGFIIGGSTKTYGIAIWNPWLIKTDNIGNEEWNKTYNYYYRSDLSGYVQSIQQTDDGGYILGCSFFYAPNDKSEEVSSFSFNNLDYVAFMVLIKTDSNGNEKWNRTYYGLEYSRCFYVRQTTDSGFIVTGGGNSISDGLFDVYLLKTSPDGSMQWLKTYGTNDMDEEGHWVQQTSDGGYIITGMSDCNYYTDWGKIWLIKTDSNGIILWNKKFEGNSHNSCVGAETYGSSVQQTSDNGLIIAGIINYQGCLIKTDNNGNEIWRKTPFINDFSLFCYSGRQTSDDGYIVTGFGLIKTDNLGNEQWNVTIPTPFISCQQTNDDGYVIAGSTSGYYGGDVWLIKFKPEDETPNLKFYITGGLGINLKITNNGTKNYNDVQWQIHVKGGIFGLINYSMKGTVNIGIGESKTAGTNIFYGFGDIQITAQVDEEIKTAIGKQFFILTILEK